MIDCGFFCRSAKQSSTRTANWSSTATSNRRTFLSPHDGTPKLLDFGIAKLLDSGAAVTRADARMLTPEYASPEQLTGAPVTTATDIYGLGMLLYQLLSGSLPFDLSSSTSPQIRELVCNTEPEVPSVVARQSGNATRAARLRGELDNIVMMALRKDPLRRYATVKDFGRRHTEFPGQQTRGGPRRRLGISQCEVSAEKSVCRNSRLIDPGRDRGADGLLYA